jgi:hypothetical protein
VFEDRDSRHVQELGKLIGGQRMSGPLDSLDERRALILWG